MYGGETMELDNNNHSVFLLYYHQVLVVKYRRKVMKEYFRSRSFCLLSTGGAPIEGIKRYIESQGEKA